MKPIARPLRGTPAFQAVRQLIARETNYPQLTDDLRKRLIDYYSPSIEALEKISGQSLSRWYAPVGRTEPEMRRTEARKSEIYQGAA